MSMTTAEQQLEVQKQMLSALSQLSHLADLSSKLEQLTNKVDALTAENTRIRQQLEIANKPVQAIWFRTRIEYHSVHDLKMSETIKRNEQDAEDDLKRQLAAWKADPSNARKLVVGETMNNNLKELINEHGNLHICGFLFLVVQFKEL